MPDGWGFTDEITEEDEQSQPQEEEEEEEQEDIPLEDPTTNDEQSTLTDTSDSEDEHEEVNYDELTSAVEEIEEEENVEPTSEQPDEDVEDDTTDSEETNGLDDQFDNAFSDTEETSDEDGDEQPDKTEEEDTTDTTSTTPGTVDVSDIAPDVVTAKEAASREETWRILVWGKEGLFKTHFCYTMPTPVVLIDTEDKSHNIADKFADEDIYIFGVNDYDEAKEALTKGIQILDRYAEQTGELGTIAIDSMSDMWTWAQYKHFQEWYPEYDDLEDAREEFTSSLQSDGPGDWRQIKRYHNNQFRQVMLDTPYHLCWTAKEQDDYNFENADDDSQDTEVKQSVKPSGEKDNVYEITDIIHATARDGQKVGDLLKSGLTNHVYYGLELPTFDKHRDVVESIRDAEASDMPVEMADFTDHGVDIKMDVKAYE